MELKMNKKYISKLADDDFKKIAERFIDDSENGNYACFVLEEGRGKSKGYARVSFDNGHEFLIDDYGIACGYGVRNANKVEYALFMAKKFGISYINDLAAFLYDKEIIEAKRVLDEKQSIKDSFVKAMVDHCKEKEWEGECEQEIGL